MSSFRLPRTPRDFYVSIIMCEFVTWSEVTSTRISGFTWNNMECTRHSNMDFPSTEQNTSVTIRLWPALFHSSLKTFHYIGGDHGPASLLKRFHLRTTHQHACVYSCFYDTLAHWQFLQQPQPFFTTKKVCKGANPPDQPNYGPEPNHIEPYASTLTCRHLGD